jgi:hypothetical protein
MRNLIKTSELKEKIGVFYIPYYKVSEDEKKSVDFYVKEFFLNDESVNKNSFFYTIENAKNEIKRQFYKDYHVLKEYHSQFIIKPKHHLVETIKKGFFKPSEIEIKSDLHKSQLFELESLKEYIDNDDIVIDRLKLTYYEVDNNHKELVNQDAIYVIDARNPMSPKFERTTVKNFQIRIKDDEISYIVKPLLFDIDTIPMEDLIEEESVWKSENEDYFVYTDIDQAYEVAIDYISKIEYSNIKEYREIMRLASKIDQIFV